ncbi:hypothetical protein Hanom_Chr16g01432191 [Helianthus anomalus]
MENVKKKRPEVNGDNKTSSKKIRAKNEHSNGGVTAEEDAEFQEFLAIINRLKAGLRCFKNRGAVAPPDGSRKTGIGDGVQNDAVCGFDLNVDPASDQMSG